jgi:hypothetical protein
MQQNGFFHQALAAGATSFLGVIGIALANGPTGGFAAWLTAHPWAIAPAATVFGAAQNWVKHMLDGFTVPAQPTPPGPTGH